MNITRPVPAIMDVGSLVRQMAGWQEDWTEQWHAARQGPEPANPLAFLVQQEHRRNFDLWHEEDKARAPDASDAQVAGVKRRIDKLNQERSNLIEQLDEAFFTMLAQRHVKPAAEAAWNTETPGLAADRLSILSLKIHHMREQEQRAEATEAHRERCRAKRQILERQRADLIVALQRVVDELFAGRQQMKLFRQFKMYNDPALNPAIYRSGAGSTEA
jgi:hypothetical protein